MLFSRLNISCFRAKAHLVFHLCLYNKVIYPVDSACKVFKLDNQDQMYGKPIFIVYQPKTWEGRGGDKHLDKNWPVSLSRVVHQSSTSRQIIPNRCK